MKFTVGRPGLEPGTDGLRQVPLSLLLCALETSIDLDQFRSDQVFLVADALKRKSKPRPSLCDLDGINGQ
jgi:hypothetical protein